MEQSRRARGVRRTVCARGRLQRSLRDVFGGQYGALAISARGDVQDSAHRLDQLFSGVRLDELAGTPRVWIS